MRISELAERVGVPTSTVRYYERVGLLPDPDRTGSGYRDYDEAGASRLLFVTRARHLGLTCEQIAELLPIWDGSRCANTQEEIKRLVASKRSEIRERIVELERFAEQLDEVGVALAEAPPADACLPDLSCCLPQTDGGTAPVELVTNRSRQR